MADFARRPRLAVVGGYGTGITVTTDRVPGAGETVISRGLQVGPGGKGSNQAVGASRLGASVALLTSVGSDDFATAAYRLWAAEGVDASFVRRFEGPTMAGVILVEATGENRILVVRGALADLGPQDADAFESWIADSGALLVSLEVPLPVVVRACELAARHGVTTIVNPAPATQLPDSLLETADYLTPNRTEAALLTGLPVASEAPLLARALRERTRATVVLTLGADGALLLDGDGQLVHLPAPTVPVVDTTGAGDAFNAAFATALLRGSTPRAAAEYGIRAGSHAVGISQVIPSLPTPALIGAPEGGTPWHERAAR
jgi:ribokinase